MKRRHSMPFGAECLEDQSVRFRLWAPAAQRVQVCLDTPSGACQLPLTRGADDWFELTTDAAQPGTQYYFQTDHAQKIPDPASRFQPQDVHGPSEVVDPAAFDWHDEAWQGRRWEDAVIYELHVGAFTPDGTFSAARQRLDYLADLGITALELMPIADFPGRRNWGYDGVFHFAPDSSYGRPHDLKYLVQDAHARGMMIFLDVVYNHFGPDGNYLRSYAPQFFTDRHHTPWGEGINFDGPESRTVRDFFIHNALYWLTEYHFDGLRLDAVHAILDDSKPDILTELSAAVRLLAPERHVHLILENDRNQASYLRRNENCQPRAYTAQWNDDIHHALHTQITGERDGYYLDYANGPLQHLGRSLVAGFAYQGETSLLRKGAARGESTAGLPLTAFISFLQNHDQIGNRAFGERIVKLADARAVRAAMAILLLAPSPPLLFMGEEFGAETPFLFFCDFEKDLAAAVTKGRRNEFAHFGKFSDPAELERIPDPNSMETFAASRLDWSELERSCHQEWLEFYRRLLRLRAQHIAARMSGACGIKADFQIHGDHGLSAAWTMPDGAQLSLTANLGPETVSGFPSPLGETIFASDGANDGPNHRPNQVQQGTLPPWSVVWSLKA